MGQETHARLRDQRKPGHGWFDNEIYDVFGDELRQDGISVYMTLARLCYGVSVRMSLREMAGHARMSKDTFARTLKRVIGLGLVIERKGATPQSASTYDLVDVKELSGRYLRECVEREKAAVEVKRMHAETVKQSVSPGDSSKDVTLVELLKPQEGMVIEAASPVDAAECRSVRQIASAPESVDKKIWVAPVATEVSQKCPGFATEVSQDLRHVRQDTRHKTQNTTTPQPPLQGGDAACPPDERKCTQCCEAAVAKVLRECAWSNPRMGRVVLRAMQGNGDLDDGPVNWNAQAEGLIAKWKEFTKAGRGGLLLRPPGPRKFVEDGLWLDEGIWPWDKQELREREKLRGRF